MAGYVVLTFKFHKTDKRWTARCEELGTATFGRSLPEAERRLEEAVSLHLDTLEEVGEQGRFFKEHGILVHRRKPTKDITVCLPLRTSTYVEPHIHPVRELSVA